MPDSRRNFTNLRKFLIVKYRFETFCGGQTRSIYFYSPPQMVHKYTYLSYRHAWYDWKVSHEGGRGEFRGYRISYIFVTSSCERFIMDKDLLTARKAIFSDVKEPVFRLSAAQMRFSRRVINTARLTTRKETTIRLIFAPVKWIPPLHVLSRNAGLRMHFLVNI